MAEPTNLTTAEKVSELTGIPATDIKSTWLNWVDALIKEYTGRDFSAATTYTDEQHDGDDTRLLIPDHPPIISVSSIKIYTSAIDSTSYAVYDAHIMLKEDYSDPVLSAIMYDYPTLCFPRGNKNVYVSYVGGYAAVPSNVEMAATLMVGEVAKSSKREGVDMSIKYSLAPRREGERSRFMIAGLPAALVVIMEELLKKKKGIYFA